MNFLKRRNVWFKFWCKSRKKEHCRWNMTFQNCAIVFFHEWKLRLFFDDVKTFFRSTKKFLKVFENMNIYRNIFVFISFASLAIIAFEKKNANNCHFYATRAKFTLNSNKHRFSIYVDDEKIIKNFKIFWSFDFQIIKRQRQRKSIKMWWFDIIQTFFQKRILFILSFFFSVTKRFRDFI